MAISSHSPLKPSSPFLRESTPLFPLLSGGSRKGMVVFARRLKGLEEAMKMRRERELLATTKRGPPLKRGKVSPTLPVPDHILKPPYVGSLEMPELSSEYQMHDSEGIARMRKACELAARVLDYAGTLVRPSVTTDEIDKAVHQMIVDNGAYPSPLGYGGFPKSVCTSVNECMCHGIPDSRQLQVTEECLEKGIALCKDGVSFKEIGKNISEHAEKHNYSVVERFVGHGVGTVFHSEPFIYHHKNEYPGEMLEGMTFTIEPILTMGSIEYIEWADKWTTVTADGGPAAQFEHSILITKTGAEILTRF
ncbi:hypothetical protein KSS87_017404 [Heliosperma pusillum]|nr:hypothetical protein KSS87_017404 [Heliosperma pusillum]